MAIEILPMQKQHAKTVAQLHIQGITTGFLSQLGPSFLTTLYSAIGSSNNTRVFVAIDENDTVKGFVAGTSNINKMYKQIILRKGWLLALLLLKKAGSLQVIKKAFETLLYTVKKKKHRNEKIVQETVTSELLSIAVDATCRGQNIGKRLVATLDSYFKDNNIDSYKVVTYSKDIVSNSFYLRCGFFFASKIHAP